MKKDTYAHASNDETIDHLETLFETNSLKDQVLRSALKNTRDILGRKLNNFVQSVEREHLSIK